jgi:hypothetical protein
MKRVDMQGPDDKVLQHITEHPMSFQIHALAAEPFVKYFNYTATQLEKIGAQRHTVTESPGTPCRVSLADAQVSETVVLLNYEHQPNNTPYRATHAIFVRKGAVQAMPDVNTVPDVLASRLLSIRGFDDAHNMRVADVVDGVELAAALDEMFGTVGVDYIHIHNAKQGCFAARVTRG